MCPEPYQAATVATIITPYLPSTLPWTLLRGNRHGTRVFCCVDLAASIELRQAISTAGGSYGSQIQREGMVHSLLSADGSGYASA
eukprot:2389711-Rhodomonas_salina.1